MRQERGPSWLAGRDAAWFARKEEKSPKNSAELSRLLMQELAAGPAAPKASGCQRGASGSASSCLLSSFRVAGERGEGARFLHTELLCSSRQGKQDTKQSPEPALASEVVPCQPPGVRGGDGAALGSSGGFLDAGAMDGWMRVVQG